MLYLTGSKPSNPEHVATLKQNNVGLMSSPNISYNTNGWTWAADNGCFSNNWNTNKWLQWLNRTHGSLFAVVPDIVGNAAATRQRWNEWWPAVVAAGHKPAYVIQDGQDNVDVPWDTAACIFVGGSTEYKLSQSAENHVKEANQRGLWTHMGRVNSYKRMLIANRWGCKSVDGTFLAFGPDRNVPRLIGWLHQLDNTPPELNLTYRQTDTP